VSKTRPPNPQPLNWWYPPNLPPPHSRTSDLLDHLPIKVRVADPSAPHVHLPPHMGSPSAGCPEDRYSLRGRIWQHALGRRYIVKPCASPAGTRTESAEGSLNWSIFSASMVSIFVS
jgi:hypothetical protein